eukprot:TRINITY_DN2916_c0_g1_i3.p1 TRINITY_DN2916_c0_g1~~TRINITY_DN2916_c0_g1_i3.p1  ORF type:complete len:272 (-),score=67.09 TRINITY_DN2916_c0_g1_i3:216-917(-)
MASVSCTFKLALATAVRQATKLSACQPATTGLRTGNFRGISSLAIQRDAFAIQLKRGQVMRGAGAGFRALPMASVSVGSKIPEAELSYFDGEGNLQSISTTQLTKGKKVVLFAVPGAFTPTCSQKHLPGFIEKADELKAKGVDTIACVAVNDAFVMKAWGEAVGAGDKVLLLADGSGKFTEALGVTLDLTDKGLGVRSRRYALLAVDGVVELLNLEEGGAFTVSGPEEILRAL